MAPLDARSYDHGMRHSPRIAAMVLALGVLGACGSSTSTSPGAATTVAGAPSGSTGASATSQPASGGASNCDALKTNMADMLVNWQVVIGLGNVAVTDWATTPVGTITKFSDQLKALTAALGSDADAAAALKFMTGADDIVVRGLGGDAQAKADLAAYLGTDIAANVQKQLPIGLAYQKAGCK